MMKKFYLRGMLGLAAWLLLGVASLQAQDERDLPPVTRTYALTNVNIVQAPGRQVSMGTLVIQDGLIKAVGKGVPIPAGATIIKADSMYVYAGFIDGFSRTGVVKPKEETSRERVKDPGNPPAERAGITPQNDVRTVLNPAEKSIEELRALGFTLSHVSAYGGMLPGNSALILLGGKSADEMVLVPHAAFYSELSGAERMYPNTVIAVMAKWRELYRQAALNKNYESLYAANRSGLEPPASDRILEAFYPIIDKRQPVLFKSERVLETQRVLALQHDLGFPIMIADLKEGWDIIGKIKAANAKVFLSLDLPEEKKDDKKEDKKGDKDKKEDKKDEKKEEKKEEKADDKLSPAAKAEKEALEKRRDEFMAKYAGQAALFQKSGIVFGFAANSAKTKDIPANLRRMIKAGLTEDQALAALTTQPAQLLGLSDRVGTVDNGKIANLVISDKPYFNEKAKVRYVFVGGVLYKYENKEAGKEGKKSNGNDVSGKWSYTAETPQGANTGTIRLKKEGSSYTGSIKSATTNQETDFREVTQDGNNLTLSFDVETPNGKLPIDMNITLDGDTFSGTMSVGQFGTFPVKGSKDPNR